MSAKKKHRLLLYSLILGLSAPAIRAQQAQTAEGAAHQEPAPVAKAKPPAEMPANLPKVTCSGDQLTVSANNSTLGSILLAVRACINVQIDLPESSSGNRIYGEFGPGPARQILTALLGSTDVDYVIGSSPSAPDKISTVILMARARPDSASPAESSLTPARRAWLESRRNGRPAASDETPAAAEASPAPAIESAARPAIETQSSESAQSQSPASSTVQPAATSDPAQPAAANQASATQAAADPTAAAAEPAPGAEADSTPPAPPKNTQDRITDMQQLFEQRRQMIEASQQPTPKQQPQP